MSLAFGFFHLSIRLSIEMVRPSSPERRMAERYHRARVIQQIEKEREYVRLSRWIGRGWSWQPTADGCDGDRRASARIVRRVAGGDR